VSFGVPLVDRVEPRSCFNQLLLRRTKISLGVQKLEVKHNLLRRTMVRPSDQFGSGQRPAEPQHIMAVAQNPGDVVTEAPRIIRKYPNRRLYDVANDGYITLADVKQLVLKNVVFQVVDAKTGADITRAILLQIILDAESGAAPMLSSEMLAQIVRFHGAAQQTMVGAYMEENVNTFLGIQKKLQEQKSPGGGNAMTLTPALWQQFMQMQAPAMQGMLGNFLEQSAKRFMEKQ
jgi:polyhydroxyalkanoate synthesis repressor PhaR